MKLLSWDIGVKHLAYALLERDSIAKTTHVLKFGVINVDQGKNKPTRCSTESFVQFVAKEENKWLFVEPDVVLIEFQLRANPRMQCMAAVVHATLLSNSIAIGHRIYVDFINASKKFNALAMPVEAKSDATRSQYYRATKLKAREIAETMMTRWGDADMLEKYKANGRSADIADAIGNAAAYLSL